MSRQYTKQSINFISNVICYIYTVKEDIILDKWRNIWYSQKSTHNCRWDRYCVHCTNHA